MASAPKSAKLLQFVALLIVFFLLCVFIQPSESNYLWRFPPLLKEIPRLINDFVRGLMFEWMPISVYDPIIEEHEQKPLFREITRAISSAFLFLIAAVRELILGGSKTIVAFTGWDFVKENPWAKWPALPWTVVVGWTMVLGYRLRGWGLSLLAGVGGLYIAIFGQWSPSMQTLSFILISAPISVFLGLIVGILAFRSRTVETILNPLLNVAQTMPHYSYLIPIIVLFGVGDHAAALVTILFATPSMVRLVLLGLKNVENDVVDAGKMSGCNNRQMLFRVLVPTAKRDVLIGVNQVVMQCLSMTVIAAFIGAQGLGSNLLIALNSLRIGTGLEIGICIVLIAVVFDKMSLAWANKPTDYFADMSFSKRYRHLMIMGVILIAGVALAYVGGRIFEKDFNYFYIVPHNKGFTTAPFWQSAVDWVWEAFFYTLKSFNEWLITGVLVPMRDAYLAMPVVATFTLVMGTAYIVAGLRSALIAGGFLLFIALSE